MEMHGTSMDDESETLAYPTVFQSRANIPFCSSITRKSPKHCIDLFELIESNPLLHEGWIRNIFGQIVDAIAYLHDMEIVHGDIKDENVMISFKNF